MGVRKTTLKQEKKGRNGGREGRKVRREGRGKWKCRAGKISPPRSFLKVSAYQCWENLLSDNWFLAGCLNLSTDAEQAFYTAAEGLRTCSAS